MKLLVVGSGGREHALCWALSASPLLSELLIAPGSSAMASLGRLCAVSVDDTDALVALAQTEHVDLVIIGPETPLVNGLADRLEAVGIKAFGPKAAAARLEGSKEFARAFCDRHNILQPAWQRFSVPAPAKAFAATLGGACVIKADGLAAGKGVIVCDGLDEAELAIDGLLAGQFGDASATILVEERITGPEISAFALLDGKTALWMASARDYKRAYDGDTGPNTGGMGAVSPSPHETEALRGEIMEKIIRPVAEGMASEGAPYSGILYAGLMLTDAGPQVIEFNCRFGDPEAQVILPRLRTDFLSAVLTQIENGLAHFDMRWSDNHAVSVVMAAKGYPGAYEKNTPIKGLHAAESHTPESSADTVIFHAGTMQDEAGNIFADGGRVLAVTSMGASTKAARDAAYAAVGRIDWPQGFYRKDIAAN